MPGNKFNLPIMPGQAGKYLRVNSTETDYEWADIGVIGQAYRLIESNTTPEVQRNILNFSLLFTVSDNVGNLSTDVTINVSNLANDSTFVTDLVANTTFMTDIANNTTFITALTSNSTFITDLSSNTTFVENIANNTDFITTLTSNSTFISNLTSNSTFITDITNIVTTGGGVLFQTNTVDNGSQALLNLIQGTNMTITEDGFGNVTFDAASGGSGTVTNIATSGSITGGPITTTGSLSLVNDSATPGDLKYYGTNSSGTKGFFDILSLSGLYTVNADETEATWMTIQFPFPEVNGTSIATGFWKYGAAGGQAPTVRAPMWIDGTSPFSTTNVMNSLKSGAVLDFADSTSIRMKFAGKITHSTTTGDNAKGIGMYIQGSGFDAVFNGNIASTAQKRVGIAWYNGNLYGICCDGVAISTTLLATYASDLKYTYSFIYEAGVQVSFFLDGSPAGTPITTNLPASGTPHFGFQDDIAAGGNTFSPIVWAELL